MAQTRWASVWQQAAATAASSRGVIVLDDGGVVETTGQRHTDLRNCSKGAANTRAGCQRRCRRMYVKAPTNRYRAGEQPAITATSKLGWATSLVPLETSRTWTAFSSS